MISTIQIDIVRIDDEGHADEHEHFDAIRSSIDDIAVEYVRIFIRRQSILADSEARSVEAKPLACTTHLMENNQEIREIPVKITDDRHAG